MRETDTDPRKTHIDRQPPTYNFDLSTLRFTYTEAKELIQLSVRVGQFQQKLSWRDISEACIQTTVHWLQLELTELELYGARAYGARSVGRVDRALERGGAQAVGRQTQ